MCQKMPYMILRILADGIHDLLNKKIILITGPRQCGKTTFVRNFLSKDVAYYNYDIKKDIEVFKKQNWDYSKDMLVFDELHKMRNWKLWLKGIYDDGILKKQKVVVTGSARLDIAKKMGDSLAGRFFSFKLHPFDLKELAIAEGKKFDAQKTYNKLMTISNFPEPFIEGTTKFYKLWQKTHSDLIIRQDLLSIEKLRDIDGIELLIELLSKRVGSTISYNSLAEDLDRDDKTVKKWITALENLYIGFKLTPYSNNVARAKKKAFKFYFYDLGKVDGDESQKLENLVALSLLKEIEYLEDVEGEKNKFHFVQTRDGKELDFIVMSGGSGKNKHTTIFEVKLSDTKVSNNFKNLGKFFDNTTSIQLVKNIDRPYTSKEGVKVVSLIDYLSKFSLRAK